MNNIIKSIIRNLVEMIKTIATVLVLAFVIKTFLVQTFIIDGSSMEPSFHQDEYLLVDKLSYRFNQPNRGDIVILIPPDDRNKDYIKRIIGLPGDLIKIDGHSISINNKKIDEKYIRESLANSQVNYYLEKKLTDDEYFVMGDNRDNSKDSRSFGAIHKSDIVGRTFLVILPTKSFRLVKHYKYSVFADN